MIRAEVQDRIAELIVDEDLAGGAEIASYDKGTKWASTEAVYASSTDGEVAYPYSMAPPAISRDSYTAVWKVRVSGTTDVLAARLRCQELAAMFVAVVARDESLGGFVTNGEAVCQVGPFSVTTRDGQATFPNGATGPLAEADISIQIETQTTNED